jgi:hypothetical protein
VALGAIRAGVGVAIRRERRKRVRFFPFLPMFRQADSATYSALPRAIASTDRAAKNAVGGGLGGENGDCRKGQQSHLSTRELSKQLRECF